ncbi:MAG: DUF177 domain-containing protein [Candidatus Eisenbacteria bacterium]|uniref:DUF177 domain-containing protein n=1 Tax=Eiseniibacteriota bacterium TaxID=2212470 RepID=A0A956N9Z2_UNCEI|nr:DUF177 domain-containing protein [Candidatus Eisenbacteria bacterium]MCB9462325.1 DUF177 domain-containing protein [Candidatus Eisenbacteria bacterium]
MDPHAPFLLRLSTVEEGESHREMVGSPEELAFQGDGFEPEGPISFRARIYRIGDRMEIRGPVRTKVRQTCGRCLEPVVSEVEAEVRVFAEPPDSRDPREREEVREDDLGIVYHDGQSVDLTDEVRQVLLVEVPWHPTCREDCRGLCPRCGANRNGDGCACTEDPVDPRWRALLDLREKAEE